MAVTSSQIFEFLESHETSAIERIEFVSSDFELLRRCLRSIILNLQESEDVEGYEVADRLRMLLSEWLTAPVQFDGLILEAMGSLGEPGSIEARWGKAISASYDAAQVAVLGLLLAENPIRVKLRSLLRELREQGRTFHVYCHKRATPHFKSLMTLPDDRLLEDADFLYSAKGYRTSAPFDALVKVGPLRSQGWGSAPDAILTAPRFTTLFQLVWSGSVDEPGFGYDPVVSLGGRATEQDRTLPPNQKSSGSGISWTSHVTVSGEYDTAVPIDGADNDDFQVFTELRQAQDRRRATLVQIDEGHGILYPPHSQVLSFDGSTKAIEPLCLRQPGETLTEGMFVVRALHADADFGGLQAGEGHYSTIWKQRLRDELTRNSVELVQRLRAGGIGLLQLRSCIDLWCSPPSTVIRAPQQKRHFEILISVLNIDPAITQQSRAQRFPWWQLAWKEIGRARGEAIQAGMQEHEIVEEELLGILGELISEIRRKSTTEKSFEIQIPVGKSLQGAVRFFMVRSIEDDFCVPEAILKVICDLDTVEQWRV